MARDDCWWWLDGLGRPPKPKTRWQNFKENVELAMVLTIITSPFVLAGVLIGYMIWH